MIGACQTTTPIQLQHMDVTLVDSSVSPCDNFYQYACGKRNAANPIPPDQMFWGVGGQLQAWNRQVLREILEKNEVPSATRTPNQQKIGDIYASCMTQSPVANDVDAIRPLLARIAALQDKREIAGVLAAMHTSFGRAWQGSDNQTPLALFGFGPQTDLNDTTRVVGSVDQGGLGMPGRDFYLADTPEMKATREKYLALIASLLKLDGASAAEAEHDAAIVLRLETAMAKAQMDNITRRDPAKLNNRYSLDQLKSLTPAFDWDMYLRGIGAPPTPLYLVSAPEFFHVVNQLLHDEDLATWKLYLRWQLLDTASETLGKPWAMQASLFKMH